MSDQHMNAADQGTQPDSGSAPNDSINVSAAGGAPQGAPGSAGSQPDRNAQGVQGNQAQVPEDGEGEQGYEASGGKDNINHIKG